MDSLVLFLWSVIDHWGSLMTGGIIIAIIVVIEHYLGKSLTWGIFLAVALLFFTYASYLAWDDEHTKLRNTEQQLATEREQLTTVRDQNAKKSGEVKRVQVAQLQRFAFLATSLIRRRFADDKNGIVMPTDPEFQKYEADANKWINDTATWILENLGEKSQQRFLNITDTDVIDHDQTDPVNQDHFNIVWNLQRYRQNIQMIINTMDLK
jgi:hypothetical protein